MAGGQAPWRGTPGARGIRETLGDGVVRAGVVEERPAESPGLGRGWGSWAPGPWRSGTERGSPGAEMR